MDKWTARGLSLVMIAGALGVVGCSTCFDAERLGLDVWNAPGLQAAVEAETRRGEALDVARTEVVRRTEAKSALAARLIEGGLTLSEAVACFREVDSACPSDDIALCRLVFGWVRADLASRAPGEATAALARLEAEARAFLQASSAGTPAH